MTYRILILSNDPSETKALVDVLNNTENEAFDIDIATHLAVGLEKLQTKNADAILVDLPLADSSGMSTFDRLFSAAPHTPIIALSAKNDEAVAMQAVERGAQATLTKGALECTLVPEVVRNIIMRRNIDEASYREKARAEIALNSISDAVLCTDIAGNIDYLNTAAEAITGWSREEARGMSISVVFKLINGITREPAKNPVELVLQKNAPMVLNADTVLVRKDGSEASIEDSASPIHDEDGKLMGVVIVFHDVSASYAIKTKMAHLAQHDALTNLPNRVLLNDRIAQAITHAKRRGTKLAVLFLDLDHFKHINDSLGHETGDKLLQSVTQRLNSCVRSSDTVSRQGGDEFVILLAEGSHEQDAALTADKIIALLNLPHFIAKQELYVTTSVGISVYPADGKDPATLIKNADTAMYHAKDKGRDNYQFFRADMNTRAVERQFMEADLRRAIENKELVLYYQPKINLVNGKIAGAEALLRWMHNDWGMLSPERFIPIAEESGLIVPIGQWVLREACTQAKRWSDAGCAPISIAVNISALEFRQENFFENVRAILYDTGLDAHCLQLEITETGLMRDAEASTAMLHKLKDIGVQLAIDDFGTGYSSLSYLRKFPVDALKIDQSFIKELGSIANDGGIVSAVIAMGSSLKLKVIAEGVENQEQLAFLKAHQCEEGQGNFFSKPLTTENFATLLANNASRPAQKISVAEYNMI